MTNLALVGVGAWGKNYLQEASKIPGIKIKYISAQSDKSLMSIKGDFIKVKGYENLFKYKDIDGVILATPNSTHFEILSEFLKKDINVLIEKPLVESYSDSLELEKIKKASKSYVQVGHIYLFDPAYIEAKNLTKKLGKIRYLSFEGTGSFPVRKGTSVLWDIGTHALSLCFDIYDKYPKNISATGVSSLYPESDDYDFASIKIKFEDNVSAFIKISWIYPIKKRELAIVGEKDSIIYDAQGENKIIYYKNMIGKKSEFHSKINSVKISYPKYASRSPLENEIDNFVKAIEDKKLRRSDMSFGIKITKLLDLAQKSIKNNGREFEIR